MEANHYITTQLIDIIYFNEITPYRNMITAEALLHSKIISHTEERRIRSPSIKNDSSRFTKPY